MLASFLVTTVVLLSSLCGAQAQNITLLGQTNPISNSISFGDIWAEGNIACMGVWLSYSAREYGVGIFDISDPKKPNRLTTYFDYSAPNDNQFEQGVVRNKIGYFASWSGGGIHIVSLTNPAAPVLLSKINTAQNGFSRVHTMWLERNFLYEAAHVAGITNVKVFDVSNVFAPVYLQDIVTTNTTKVHQITVGNKGTNTILYTSGWGGANDNNTNSFGQTDIWDVSNVGTQPARWLGRIYSGYNSHSSWPTPDGNTLVVCRETPGGEVSFYDITTPPNPLSNSGPNPAPFMVISPASMGLTGYIPHNPAIIGNLLFLSWYQNGIQVFDISDKTKPVRLGSYDTYLTTGSTNSYQGNWGVYPFLGLNRLLLSDIQTGLYILDASAVLTNTNSYPPLLVKSPTNVTSIQGGNAAFQPTVTGSSLQYQWRFNGTNLSGATNSVLSLTTLQSNQSGSYQVLASNSFGSVTSAIATLSIVVSSNAPVITSHPQSVSVYPGQPATFSAAVVGGGPFYFQWRFKGNDVSGATNNSLTISNVAFVDVGNYAVLVTNAYGATLSSNAFLTIIDSPYINGVQSAPGLHSAAVSWNTSMPTEGRVDYGPVATIGVIGSSYSGPHLSTNHSVLLTGLSPATTYNFQIVSEAGGSNYISAIYTFTTAGAPIIIDNTNSAVTYTGTWTSSTNVSGYYGINYRVATVSTSTLRTATFMPTIPVAGNYDVYTRYAASTSDRATNAPYTIYFDGGFTTVPVNQTINNGIWNLLSTEVPFNAGTGGFVQLANNAYPWRTSGNTVVIADAVQFVYSQNQDSPTNGGFPTWWSDFYFGGGSSPTGDPDGDGFSTGQEFILGTSPVSSHQTFSVETFRSGGSVNIVFWPMHSDRSYTLLRSSNLSSGWQEVVAEPEAGGINGGGVFNVSLVGTNQAFYKISVQLSTNTIPLRTALRGGIRPFVEAEGEETCGPNRIYVR